LLDLVQDAIELLEVALAPVYCLDQLRLVARIDLQLKEAVLHFEGAEGLELALQLRGLAFEVADRVQRGIEDLLVVLGELALAVPRVLFNLYQSGDL